MRIGIIGAGAMGRILARKLAGLGHQVLIANARGPSSLAAVAADAGARAVTVAEAAKAAHVAILAIPTKAVTDLPRDLFAHTPGEAIIVDIGNYHPELRDGRITAIDDGMLDSEWVAHRIGRPVVKAFNSILAESLLAKGMSESSESRVALPVAGDDASARAIVLGLVDDLGFDPVDAGDLSESFRQQPGTPAYCRDLDIAALRTALTAADRSRVAEYRAAREAEIRTMMAEQASR